MTFFRQSINNIRHFVKTNFSLGFHKKYFVNLWFFVGYGHNTQVFLLCINLFSGSLRTGEMSEEWNKKKFCSLWYSCLMDRFLSHYRVSKSFFCEISEKYCLADASIYLNNFFFCELKSNNYICGGFRLAIWHNIYKYPCYLFLSYLY